MADGQRRARYDRLIQQIRSYHPDAAENREALAELQSQIALDQLESAETSAGALTRATWALVGMTAALVIATVVLIIVTARHHG